MFTVNIKGKRDPKNINFVKLEWCFISEDIPA